MSDRDTHGEWSEEARSLSRQLLAESRKELERADTKAIGLLSLYGLFAGVVLAGMVAGDWSPSTLTITGRCIWWVGVVITIVSFVLLGSALWPRTKKTRIAQNRECVTYFGDVDDSWNVKQLGQALDLTCDRLPERDAEQLLTIAKYAKLKYSLVRWGMALYLIGTLTIAAGVVLGH